MAVRRDARVVLNYLPRSAGFVPGFPSQAPLPHSPPAARSSTATRFPSCLRASGALHRSAETHRRMARNVEELSIDEIRQRYLDNAEPVSARVLNLLQRDPRQGAKRLHAALKRRFARERDERLRMDAMRHFEKLLWKSGTRDIAGVDEVGRGPLARPGGGAAGGFLPGTDSGRVAD